MVDTPLNFNSHARVGRDVEGQEVRQVGYDFNSHARVGRDAVNLEETRIPLFQLTRPCRA